MAVIHRPLLLLLIAVSVALPSTARFDFSAGVLLSYPGLITGTGSAINSGHLGGGIRLGVEYNANRGHFFPSLHFSSGQYRLPLQQEGINEGSLNFNMLSLMLNGAYAAAIRERQIVCYSGLGVSRLKLLNLAPGGTVSDIVRIDSSANIQRFFPAAHAGIEYRGITTGRKFYLATGISLSYVALLKGYNTYYLQILRDNKITAARASFEGHLLIPSVYLAVAYRSGKRKNDWYMED